MVFRTRSLRCVQTLHPGQWKSACVLLQARVIATAKDALSQSRSRCAPSSWALASVNDPRVPSATATATVTRSRIERTLALTRRVANGFESIEANGARRRSDFYGIE